MRYKKIEERFEEATEMLGVQLTSSQGSGSDDYMQGMYNGMAFMLSIFDQQEPNYISSEEYKDISDDNTSNNNT